MLLAELYIKNVMPSGHTEHIQIIVNYFISDSFCRICIMHLDKFKLQLQFESKALK